MDEEADYNENQSDFDDYSSSDDNNNRSHPHHHHHHHQMASSPNTKLIQMNQILNEAHLSQLHQQQQQQLMNPTMVVTSSSNNSVLNTSLSNNSNNNCNGGSLSKKPRLVFTDIQRRTLQAIFKETKRPSKEMQVTIAQQLGLEVTTVSNFFMNARRRSMDKWRDHNDDDNSNCSLFK